MATSTGARKKAEPKLVLTESEHDHQVRLFEWFIKEPLLRKYRVWSEAEGRYLFPACAVPNARKISVGGMNYYKAEGLQPGFPDVLLLIPSFVPFNMAAGLVIEMKSPARRKQKNGGVAPNQQEWLDLLKSVGWNVAACWCFEEAQEAVLRHLGLWEKWNEQRA